MRGRSIVNGLIRGWLPGIAVILLFLSGDSIPAQTPSTTVPGFVRGDINGDLNHDLSDPVLLLEELFGSGSGLPCTVAADINGDQQLLLDVPDDLLVEVSLDDGLGGGELDEDLGG